MPARSRIKTVSYSKESKKAPGYGWSVSSQRPIRIACCSVNRKVITLPSVLFGGTPYSTGIPLPGGGPTISGSVLFGGRPDRNTLFGGTPTSSGSPLSGGGPTTNGPVFSGGNI